MSYSHRPANILTPSEHEILTLSSQGLTRQQIAVELNVAVRTVDFHTAHIFKKLGVHNTIEAIYTALNKKLISLLPPKIASSTPLRLTSRQREVLNALSKGKGYKGAGKLLCISAKTVHFHVTCMFEENNFNSIRSLLVVARWQSFCAQNKLQVGEKACNTIALPSTKESESKRSSRPPAP